MCSGKAIEISEQQNGRENLGCVNCGLAEKLPELVKRIQNGVLTKSLLKSKWKGWSWRGKKPTCCNGKMKEYIGNTERE